MNDFLNPLVKLFLLLNTQISANQMQSSLTTHSYHTDQCNNTAGVFYDFMIEYERIKPNNFPQYPNKALIR